MLRIFSLLTCAFFLSSCCLNIRSSFAVANTSESAVPMTLVYRFEPEAAACPKPSGSVEVTPMPDIGDISIGFIINEPKPTEKQGKVFAKFNCNAETGEFSLELPSQHAYKLYDRLTSGCANPEPSGPRIRSLTLKREGVELTYSGRQLEKGFKKYSTGLYVLYFD